MRRSVSIGSLVLIAAFLVTASAAASGPDGRDPGATPGPVAEIEAEETAPDSGSDQDDERLAAEPPVPEAPEPRLDDGRSKGTTPGPIPESEPAPIGADTGDDDADDPDEPPSTPTPDLPRPVGDGRG